MHPPEARSRIHREQQPGVFSALVAQIPQAVQWAHLSSSKLDFQFVAPKDLVVIYPPIPFHSLDSQELTSASIKFTST